MIFREKVGLIFFVFITIVVNSCFQISLSQSPVGINGAYRFVSETTTLERPRRVTTYRKPPEWQGLFLFTDGFFTVSLTDNSRSGDWLTKFPKNIKEVGYESFAGKYEIKGTTLTLNSELGLHPFWDSRGRIFNFKIEGENLTLTQTLSPYVEDMRKGKRVIILSKLKSE